MSLRIGVVGLGRGVSLLSVFQVLLECKVTAVCERTLDTARSFAEANQIPQWFDNLEDFLASDIDVVVIATPPPVHAKHCIQALQAGKHVMSEVPAVWTLEEGNALVEAVEASGQKYMFAENMNYMGFLQTFDKIVKDGRIGDPYYAEAEYIHDCRFLMTARPDGITPGSETGRTWRAYMPPIHYCTHSLGPLLQIMDDRIVSATGLHTGPRVGAATETIDMEVGLFKTEKGNVIKITCGFAVAREPSFHYFSIYGTEGCLETPRGGYEAGGYKAILNDIPNCETMITLPLSWSHSNMPPEAYVGGHGTCEYLMVKEFVDCVINDKPSPIDVYFGLDMTLPGICAHMSAEQGGIPIEVPRYIRSI